MAGGCRNGGGPNIAGHGQPGSHLAWELPQGPGPAAAETRQPGPRALSPARGPAAAAGVTGRKDPEPQDGQVATLPGGWYSSFCSQHLPRGLLSGPSLSQGSDIRLGGQRAGGVLEERGSGSSGGQRRALGPARRGSSRRAGSQLCCRAGLWGSPPGHGPGRGGLTTTETLLAKTLSVSSDGEDGCKSPQGPGGGALSGPQGFPASPWHCQPRMGGCGRKALLGEWWAGVGEMVLDGGPREAGERVLVRHPAAQTGQASPGPCRRRPGGGGAALGQLAGVGGVGWRRVRPRGFHPLLRSKCPGPSLSAPREGTA